MTRRVGLAVLGAAVVVALAAPAAYTLSTVRTSHTGVAARPRARPARAAASVRAVAVASRVAPAARVPNFAGGLPPGVARDEPVGAADRWRPGPAAGFGGAGGAGGFPGGGGGGIGGLLNGTTVGSKLSMLLQDGSDGYRWTAAAVGANNAASYQLASGEAVMAIGGFNGSDPAPTLAQFQAYVHRHEIHYFIGGGVGGGPGGSGSSSAITTWVAAHYKTTTVGGVTLYDFTQPT